MTNPCSACVRYRQDGCDVDVPENVRPTDQFRVKKESSAEVDSLKERLNKLEAAIMHISPPLQGHSSSSDEISPGADGEFSFNRNKRPVSYRDLGLRHLGPLRWYLLIALDDGFFRSFQHSKPWFIQTKCAQWNADVRIGMGGMSNSLNVLLNSAQLGPVDLRKRADVSPDDVQSLQMGIQEALPTRRLVWMLIDRFFKVVYPFMPILDEVDFRDQLSHLIGPSNAPGELIEVNFRTIHDFAHLGQLLVVLRFATVSLYTSANELSTSYLHNSAEEISYLALANVDQSAIVKAELCLNHYDLVQEVSLEIIQLVVLLRGYLLIDPDSATPDIRHHAFTSVMVLMANSRYLNRDPLSVFTADSLGPRKILLLRKLWYTVVNFDYHMSSHSGNHLLIHPKSFDVELPVFKPVSLNIEDSRLDTAVCESFGAAAALNELFVEGIKLTGQISAMVSLTKVHFALSKLEEMEARSWRKLCQDRETLPRDHVASFERAFEFTLFSKVLHFCTGVNIHLFYHHFRKHEFEVANIFRRKILHYVCDHVVPFFPALLQEDRNPFSSSTDFVTVPVFANCMVQSLGIIWTIFTDYRIQWVYIQNSASHVAKLAEGSTYQLHFDLLTRACDYLRDLLDLLGTALAKTLSRYRFHEKVYGVHQSISKISSSDKFFQGVDTNPLSFPSTSFLEDVCALIGNRLDDKAIQGFWGTGLQKSTSPSLGGGNSFMTFTPDFNSILLEDFLDF